MPDQARYDNFVEMRAAGRKKDAAVAVRAFIASFVDNDDRARWTRWFLDTHPYGERIRHELYTEVIFPVLKAGYEVGDAWSLYWLAGTSQNLYFFGQMWRESDVTLLQRALEIDPGHEQARLELIRAYIRWFAYAGHEWPSAILVGNDGASIEDCDAYLSRVADARSLGPDAKQIALLDDFAAKLKGYRARLAVHD